MSIDEPVHLVAYSARWPQVFAAERGRLCRALGVAESAFEHIGSTAVPRLTAKPIVDFMLGVEKCPPPTVLRSRIVQLGYEDLGEAGVPGRTYFRIRRPQAFNLHVVRRGGAHWKSNLALRDYLRSHLDAAAKYGDAKREALVTGKGRLQAYSRAKAFVLDELLAEARAWSNR